MIISGGWVSTNADKEADVQVKFKQPSGPGRSFQWPHVGFLMIFYVKLTFS